RSVDARTHVVDQGQKPLAVSRVIDAQVVAQSLFARVPPQVAAQALEGGYRIDLPAGAQPGGPVVRDTVALVVEGLVRIFLESDAGRQVTVRYARPGEMLGLVHFLSRKTRVRAQAIVPSAAWAISSAKLRTLCTQHPQLAIAIAEECAARAADAMDEL